LLLYPLEKGNGYQRITLMS